jgi:hypothetical protein
VIPDQHEQRVPTQAKAGKSEFVCRHCGYGIAVLRSQASAPLDVWRTGLARTRAQAGDVNSSRRELHDWYLRRLRPRVAHAARRGAIAPARAAELERQMNDLLAPGASRLPSTRG